MYVDAAYALLLPPQLLNSTVSVRRRRVHILALSSAAKTVQLVQLVYVDAV